MNKKEELDKKINHLMKLVSESSSLGELDEYRELINEIEREHRLIVRNDSIKDILDSNE